MQHHQTQSSVGQRPPTQPLHRVGDGATYVTYLQVPVSPRPRAAVDNHMPLHQPPSQLYSVQPANVTHLPDHLGNGFIHQQNQEPTMATGTRHQVQNGLRGRHLPLHIDGSSPPIIFSRTPQVIALARSSLPSWPDPSGDSEHVFSQPPRMLVPQPGKRRALIIGINYTSHPNPSFRLSHCVEDAYSMANFLFDHLGFTRDDIRIMTDESHSWCLPTEENILREIKTLVHGAQHHDSLFFYYSGHIIQIKDMNGPGGASDGLDECICAMDYRGDDPYPNPDTPGLIIDDVMHDTMVKALPSQCRLTAIFDSCHSGNFFDLPYLYDPNGAVKEFRPAHGLRLSRMVSTDADVVSLGMVRGNRGTLETSRGGVLRLAFIDCMTRSRNNVTYVELIKNLREYMKRHGFLQRPLLSSSHEIDMNSGFTV